MDQHLVQKVFFCRVFVPKHAACEWFRVGELKGTTVYMFDQSPNQVIGGLSYIPQNQVMHHSLPLTGEGVAAGLVSTNLRCQSQLNEHRRSKVSLSKR